MSIVTYENVDTPVFELDTMRYLFRDGLQGMWVDFRQGYVFADTDLTIAPAPGEGIAGYLDRSGNGLNGTQPVITARPIFRVGPPRAEYDGADDVLPSSLTIPSISEGCFILVGTAGIWIDNEWVNTTGTLTVGPTTYTGGPEGILPVVGDVLSIIVRDEPLTAQERQKVIQAGVKRGAPGLLVWSEEINPDPHFSSATGWALFGDSVSIANGKAIFTNTTVVSDSVSRNNLLSEGEYYKSEVTVDSTNRDMLITIGQGGSGSITRAIPSAGSYTFYAHYATAASLNRYRILFAPGVSEESPGNAEVSYMSLKRLILEGSE